MMRKTIFFLLILTLVNCDYQPIYTNDNANKLIIQEYQLTGDKNINRKIISLLNFKKEKNNNSGHILTLNSIKTINTVAKDKTGKTSVFKTSVTINIRLNKNDNLIREKSFNATYTYNNSENKFDLMKYQKIVEDNLVDKLSEEIIIFLNT